MGQCNDLLLKKIGVGKMDKNTESTLRAFRDLNDCKVIRTKDYYDGTKDTAVFDKLDVPANLLEADRKTAINSGALVLGAGEYASYELPWNAVDFQAGYVVLYVKGTNLPKVEISSDKSFASSAVLSSMPQTLSSDWNVVVYDLGKATSWVPSVNGAYLKVTAESAMRISTIMIFDDIEEFLINDVIKFSCMENLSDVFDMPLVDSTCFESEYDIENVKPNDGTITAVSFTANIDKANPVYALAKEDGDENGYKLETKEYTIDAEGKISIAGFSYKHKGFTAIQVSGIANTTDSVLSQLNLPYSEGMLIETDMFVIEDKNGEFADIHFSTELAGKKVTVSYPKKAFVERYVAKADNVIGKRYVYTWNYKTTDGVEYVITYPNFKITSFNEGVDKSEFSKEIGYSIQKDENGVYAYKDRIM